MNLKKTVSLAVVFLMVLLVLAGCQAVGTTESQSASATSASAAATSAAATSAAAATEASMAASAGTSAVASAAASSGEKAAWTVGVSYLWIGDDYMKNMQNTFQTYAKENNITLIEKNANSNGDQQVKDLENFITSKVNAIIYQPVTSTTGVPQVQEAMAANIPVVQINTFLQGYTDWGKGKVFAATSDATTCGLQMGELMAKLLNEKGNIAIIEGQIGSAASDDRVQGMKWILEHYPNMKVSEDDQGMWARDESYTLMSNWLAKGNQIDGRFGC